MPHMRAQEHESVVDAILYGTARTQATIEAAIAGIGADFTRLILTCTGDGVWTLSSNLTIPSQIFLEIPPGTSVFRPTGVTLTLNGGVISYQSNWETGPGTTVRTVAHSIELPALRTNQLNVVQPTAGAGINLISGVSGNNKQVLASLDTGSGNTGFLMSADNTNNAAGWVMNVLPIGSLAWARPGASHFMLLNASGLGIGLATVPGVLLELGADSARKPSTNTWTVTSDAQVKDVQSSYTQGMAFVRTLPQAVWAIYNGKGNTPTDAPPFVTYVAQELQAVAPTMVGTYSAKLNADDPDETTLLTVNLSELTYALVNALKELDTRLAAVEGPALRRAPTTAPETEDVDDDETPEPRVRRSRRKD
jgi:hypothetical protein